MSRKFRYEIIINDGKCNGEPYTYQYGSTKNIAIYIQSQKAVITFEQGSKKSFEDLISFKMKLFRDAFRKVYLIHALKHDHGLSVKKLELVIDGERKTYDDSFENFPFLFSMIKSRKQGLPAGWKAIIPSVLSIPKSKKDTDLRFCAIFSYLAAKNRDYRIDRFTNLWTAMNAYGNYMERCYEKWLAQNYDMDQASNGVKSVVTYYGEDGNMVNIQALLLKRPLPLLSRKESDEFWKDNYEVQKALNKIPKADYQELYEEAFKALDDGYEMPEKFKALSDSVAPYGHPLFVFLLTDYPYHLRCNYLHGSYSTILFSSYNDYEINSLGVVNHFLDQFLGEKLPEIFREDFFDQSLRQDLMECLRIVRGEKNGENNYDRRMGQLIRK